MLPNNVEVLDNSTEALTAFDMFNLIVTKQRYQVAGRYVNRRNRLGLPYIDAPTGLVDLEPKFEEKDFLVISIGGNDFAKRFEMNPTRILESVK